MPKKQDEIKNLTAGLNYTMNAFNASIFEIGTGKLIARATALSDSAVTIALETQEVRGGTDNGTKMVIPSSKTLSANLVNVAFSEDFISLASGGVWNLGEVDVFGQEESINVVDTAGVKTITLANTPVGDYVYIQNGTNNITVAIDTANPKIIDVTRLVSTSTKCVQVLYATTKKALVMDIKGDAKPSSVHLVLDKPVYRGTGSGIEKTLIIDIPNFQPDGNFEFTSTLGANDTMALAGSALSAISNDCGSTEQVLGTVKVTEPDGGFVYVDYSYDDEFELNVGDLDTLTVSGLLGSEVTFNPVTITSDCTFVSDTPASVTISAIGEITAVSATPVGTPAKITITYEGNVIGVASVEVI